MKDLKNPIIRTAYHAHMEYVAKEPEWMYRAVEVLNGWKDKTLVHTIAEALKEYYEMGLAGESPPTSEKVIVKRTRRTQEPSVQPAIIRRRR